MEQKLGNKSQENLKMPTSLDPVLLFLSIHPKLVIRSMTQGC